MLVDTLFPVKEVPVTYDVPGWDEGKASGYKLIVREDNNKILSCMTNDYRVVTNKEIIDTAAPLMKKHKAILEESIVLGDGQKSVWKWRIPGMTIKIAEDDMLNPEIIIKNSYDGSLQVHILAGAFRLICSNGMVIGVTLGQKNYKHSVNNKNLDFLDEAIENTIDYSLSAGQQFELLADTKLDEKHIMKLVEMFPSQMSQFLVEYLIARKPQNYWDLLNVGTYLATHKMRREYQSTHKTEQEIFPSVTKWAKAVAKA